MKAQAKMRIRAVSTEPSLFAYIKYGNRQRVRLKIRHLAPLDGCACASEEWVYGGRKVPYLMTLLKYFLSTGSVSWDGGWEEDENCIAPINKDSVIACGSFIFDSWYTYICFWMFSIYRRNLHKSFAFKMFGWRIFRIWETENTCTSDSLDS